ncbi:lipoprotein Spr [Bradyrhizobium sp. S3.2.6]|uniref:NlpC/P60 family protein n=1 Tax=Bradyrhizobium sp. S3.2.6 TaxID=3156428 RepID=UPI0033957E8F
MEYTTDTIPAQFWRIKYDQDHDGSAPLLPSISESPNCQNFAYALLKHFGHEISPFRSSNLWEDVEETVVVTGELRALDLLLFNRTSSPWGAHVALYLGGGKAIHLSKKESTAVIWPSAQFQTLAEYQIFIGAKRLRKFGGTN